MDMIASHSAVRGAALFLVFATTTTFSIVACSSGDVTVGSSEQALQDYPGIAGDFDVAVTFVTHSSMDEGCSAWLSAASLANLRGGILIDESSGQRRRTEPPGLRPTTASRSLRARRPLRSRRSQAEEQKRAVATSSRRRGEATASTERAKISPFTRRFTREWGNTGSPLRPRSPLRSRHIAPVATAGGRSRKTQDGARSATQVGLQQELYPELSEVRIIIRRSDNRPSGPL